MQHKKLIDTNFLIRIIVGDHQDLYQKAIKEMQNIEEGKYFGIIAPIIIGEVIYVLHSPKLYGLTREQITQALHIIMRSKNIITEEKAIILQTLELFAHTLLDFADCYLIAKYQKEKIDSIITFDKQILYYL